MTPKHYFTINRQVITKTSRRRHKHLVSHETLSQIDEPTSLPQKLQGDNFFSYVVEVDALSLQGVVLQTSILPQQLRPLALTVDWVGRVAGGFCDVTREGWRRVDDVTGAAFDERRRLVRVPRADVCVRVRVCGRVLSARHVCGARGSVEALERHVAPQARDQYAQECDAEPPIFTNRVVM